MAALARTPGATDVASGQETPVGVDLLLFFTAVAEELSFTRAARRLGIDQSWLSHKIRQLESELACSLFARTTRRIELTAAGKALLEPSQALARATDVARRAARDVSAGFQGALRIGALPYSFSNPDRVRLVDQFITEHPETDIDVSNGSSMHLVERLRRGEIDLAFACWPFDPVGLEMLSVRLDRFCFLIPRGHSLEAKAAIGLEDIAGHRMVMPSKKHNPYTFESLYAPFLRAGAVQVTVAEFQQDTMHRFAERYGIPVICHDEEALHLGGDAFVVRQIVGHDAVSRKCLVRQRGHRTPAIEAFWDLALANGVAPFDAVASR